MPCKNNQKYVFKWSDIKMCLVLDLANLVTSLAKLALANLVNNLTKPSQDLDKSGPGLTL